MIDEKLKQLKLSEKVFDECVRLSSVLAGKAFKKMYSFDKEIFLANLRSEWEWYVIKN